MRALLLDASAWQSVAIPFGAFAAGGIDGAIVKCDKQAAVHFPAMRSSGMVSALYWWLDPTYTPETQIGYLDRYVDTYNPDFLAYDVEQWWANWTLYWQYLARTITAASVPKVTQTALFDHTSRFLQLLPSIYDGRTVCYTAKWFTNSYFPRLPEIVKEPMWLATYYTADPIYASFDQLQKIADSLGLPLIPAGSAGYAMRQFASTMRLPGYERYNLDMNFFNGTSSDLYDWCNKDQLIPEPEPQFTVPHALGKIRVVASPYLNARLGPGVTFSDKGDLLTGTEWYFFDQNGPWVEIGAGVWVCTGAGLSTIIETYAIGGQL
jgi:hypothetical protein